MPIIDALLLCHVSWVIGIESGPKKIGSSQRYEVEKLAQYRWDIRYIWDHPFKTSAIFRDFQPLPPSRRQPMARNDLITVIYEYRKVASTNARY